MSAFKEELEGAVSEAKINLKDGIPEKYRQFVDVDETNGKADGQVTWSDGDTPPSHAEILAVFGLPSDEWRITSQRRSRWQQRPDTWLNAIRITAEPIPRNDSAIVQADLDILLEDARKWKPLRPTIRQRSSGPDGTFVYALSDWQLGKGEGGGSAAIAARILASLDRAVQTVQDYRRLGYSINQVAMIGLGDIVEQCQGHYPMQAFQADLDMRQQRRLAVELMMAHVRAFSQIADVKFAGIGGNHGESRVDGKAFTTFGDNDDLLAMDMVRAICLEARYPNVEIILPDDQGQDPLTTTIETSGITNGLAHGHQFGKGQGHSQKALEWWRGQTLGDRSVATADILWTGHYHSLSAVEYARRRTLIQASSQDGGSAWFTQNTGLHSLPGATSALVGENIAERGWDFLRIL